MTAQTDAKLPSRKSLTNSLSRNKDPHVTVQARQLGILLRRTPYPRTELIRAQSLIRAQIDLCADKRPGFPYPRTELSRAQIPYSRTEPLNHGQYVK